MSASTIKARLLTHFANPTTELTYQDPYQLLVAVLLSAQCTDARVNATTPAFFAKYPDMKSLASANFAEVLECIKSISYPNSKAKHLIKMANQVLQNFQGQIPQTQAELKSLAGIGQKSANVVLSVAFGANLLAVDTHVFRVAHRLGLSNAKSAKQTESDLSALFINDLSLLHHAMILFGRRICKAIHPKCSACFLQEFCVSRANFKPR
ncbi:Endonuclease III [Helicobacter ailurogastricus]|uniref:Endonuclease III n=1 Tax=Helicobacter ailurogastricus TaxID=1578720 RepID=A0A0K2Y7H0_9HELI|nr:endonuclease III [Helicobacter ailurogastricus]BDQ28565.1 endonuclease III [Helicobacter ailurogastricus]GMB90195.1 Endonuclease III [Helicobacter ailurogastricus]CRF53095.1 Endonuclease III [Helicobacter ailurogastricus]